MELLKEIVKPYIWDAYANIEFLREPKYLLKNLHDIKADAEKLIEEVKIFIEQNKEGNN